MAHRVWGNGLSSVRAIIITAIINNKNGAVEQTFGEGLFKAIGADSGSCRHGSIFAKYVF